MSEKLNENLKLVQQSLRKGPIKAMEAFESLKEKVTSKFDSLNEECEENILVNYCKEGVDIEMQSTRSSRMARFFAFREHVQEYLAEFLGSFLLVGLGTSAIANAVLNPSASSSAYLIITIGFTLSLTLGVYVSHTVSEAHLNSAVTLAQAILGKFPWYKVPGYILSQILGSFCGGAICFLINLPAITNFDKGIRTTIGPTATAGILATYPAPFLPTYYAFFLELISTMFLVIGVSAVTDPKNGTPKWFVPCAIGSVLGSIGLTTGWLTEFALNPSRDLGPRIFTAIAGYGPDPFTAYNYYFWVPIVGPIVGALVGFIVYDLFIIPIKFTNNLIRN